MASTRTSRSNTGGSFHMCIDGLPSAFTWQDVKDLARTRAEHGLRADPIQLRRATGEQSNAWLVHLGRRNEALSLYDCLTSQTIAGRWLTVHLREQSVGFLRKNCTASELPCSVCNPPQMSGALNGYPVPPVFAAPMSGPPVPPLHNFQYTIGPPPVVAQPLPAAYPPRMAGLSYQAQTAPPLQQPAIDQRALQAVMAAARQRVANGDPFSARERAALRALTQMTISDQETTAVPRSQPAYTATAASGARINTSNGVALTEIRGVFVQGLGYSTRASDVRNLFSRAGRVTSCEVHVNSQGKSKGTATVQFETAEEARTAINTLDKFELHKRILKVRPDREVVVTTAPPTRATSSRPVTAANSNEEPIIADGSNSRQIRRDSKLDGK